MRKLKSLLSIALLLIFIATSCSEDEIIFERDDKPKEESKENEENNEYVNEWIYENMLVYYLWNNDIPDKPDFSNNPKQFFESILSDKDKTKEGRRFSWIQENYLELSNSLSGVKSDEIGFEYEFVWADEAQTHVYALVTYPKIGSDAYNKGIDRGRYITRIDGKKITVSNRYSLFTGTGSRNLTMADWIDGKLIPDDKVISVRMEENFAENPVYLDSVYTIDDKKIGYLVYNFFATGKDDDSHEYDILLMNTLSKIQEKGGPEMKEMVLDLRYNSGGAVSTAVALASALVKDRDTTNVLVNVKYNNLLDEVYKKDDANYNKDFFIDKIFKSKRVNNKIVKEFIADIPSLDLSKLYVLVSRNTASASELVINGLKPYMDVVLIGETTYGKNVGSITISKKNDPKNKWGMQPIVAEYKNSAGDSELDGFTPDYEVNELETPLLVEFGNIEDPLLSKAIEQITGKISTRSTISKQVDTQPRMMRVKDDNLQLKDRAKFELYDDIREGIIKELMNSLN
ncbi:MAG: S41 family peptidase [Dysgonamonadaceae bacterium]|nr:S41 family peptidase [Dysgonamonadaceae bacterium]